jgi:hypothetical protein
MKFVSLFIAKDTDFFQIEETKKRSSPCHAIRFEEVGSRSTHTTARQFNEKYFVPARVRESIAMLGLTRKTRAKSEPPVQPNLQPYFEVLCFPGATRELPKTPPLLE